MAPPVVPTADCRGASIGSESLDTEEDRMATVSAKKKPLYKSLYAQVIAAIIIGVVLGHFWPHTGEAMKPLGDAFIKLIKMIIAPIIFCTVVIGIAGMEDMKKVGKTG